MLVGNTKFHAIRFISIPIATDNAASTGIAICVVCNHIKGIFIILNALHRKTSPRVGVVISQDFPEALKGVRELGRKLSRHLISIAVSTFCGLYQYHTANASVTVLRWIRTDKT